MSLNRCTFGEYSLDIRNQLLFKAGEPVYLQPKVFQTLVLLVQAYPGALSKEELRSALWPDTVVEEAALTQAIYALRKSLGNDAEGKDYLQTLPRRGYRFQSPVTAQQPAEERRTEGPPPTIRKTGHFLVAALAAVIAASGIFWWRPWRDTAATTYTQRAVELTEQGRAIWKQRRQSNSAEVYFRRAVDLDPKLLSAQVGLADTLAFSPPSSPEAERLIQHVLSKDPEMGEAHATAGFLAMIYHWDWSTAAREFERAVQLAPRYTTALQWQALYHSLRGDSDRALAILDAALKIEPASVNLLSERCRALYFALRTDEAIAACNAVLAIDPGFLFAHQHLMSIYSYLDNATAALPHFFPCPGDSAPESCVAYKQRFETAAQGGRVAALWQERIRQMHASPLPNTSYFWAVAYAFQRDYDHALQELESACEHHEFMMVFVAAEPVFAPMRMDARLQSICARVGLPQRTD